ncbi:hypothetical protein H310_07914 [Aphanomyces invadans]|uniref:CID domain-containing protein n=1 Tax=Aphanomyces invadans TaxID=157072 RepID=A0A024U0Z4_9STRA|nr:hypothetical protein H310_07914 [Aphanomyces invadans]ETV99879.1 hypothetical protein H310_07914 [Aphanomyces invadans]|eukprot:XP_008871655.1 hypothetical protein H310_07914 [Aphanomyces invadans]
MGDKIVNTLKQYDGMINEMGAYPAKPIINTLTMLAEDLALAKHIAPFLVKKLNVVGPPYRLPILYLMDSIIKNVGGPYAFLFSQTLAPVYVDSVRQVNATDLNRFNHVLKTWETARLLPSAVLLKMRAAADAALRVAQPSDQPASFSRGGAPPASRGVPPRSSDAHLELQMRRLLTQLQTEDGVHPAKQVSLEEVRTQNPELYAHLRLSVVEAEVPPAHHGPPPVLGHRPPPQNYPLQPRPHQGVSNGVLPLPSRSPPRPHHHQRPAHRPSPYPDAPPHEGGLLPPPSAHRGGAPPSHYAPVRSQGPPPPVSSRRWSPPPHHSMPPSQPPMHPSGPNQPPATAPSGQDVMNLLKKISAMSSSTEAPPTSSRRYQHQVSSASLGRPLTCSDIAVNKKRIGDNVYRLYDALPHVSSSSGLRFKDQAQLSKHMDFLFHYNRALRERTKGGISRSWYPNEAQWTTDFCAVSNSKEETSAGFVQAEAKTAVPELDKEALNAARVPVDGSITKCRICGESFTKCWDEDEEEWMYQNAVVGTIRTNDVVPKHTIFHKYCYDSAVASSKSEGILPSQLAPGSPVVVMGKRSMSQVDDNGTTTWGADRGRSDEQEQQQQDINKRLKVTHRDDDGDVL